MKSCMVDLSMIELPRQKYLQYQSMLLEVINLKSLIVDVTTTRGTIHLV